MVVIVPKILRKISVVQPHSVSFYDFKHKINLKSAYYENVNYLMTGMADELTCDSRTKNMRKAVNRKVAHAKQILAGVSPNGRKIKKRHENWLALLL